MKELLFSVTKKDFDITWFSGTGNGGQNRNNRHKCCRIQHKESGAIGTGQEERSREQNQKNAFNRLVESKKFQTWLKIKTAEASMDKEKIREEINRIVDESMKEYNLKVEYYTPE